MVVDEYIHYLRLFYRYVVICDVFNQGALFLCVGTLVVRADLLLLVLLLLLLLCFLDWAGRDGRVRWRCLLRRIGNGQSRTRRSVCNALKYDKTSVIDARRTYRCQ